MKFQIVCFQQSVWQCLRIWTIFVLVVKTEHIIGRYFHPTSRLHMIHCNTLFETQLIQINILHYYQTKRLNNAIDKSEQNVMLVCYTSKDDWSRHGQSTWQAGKQTISSKGLHRLRKEACGSFCFVFEVSARPWTICLRTNNAITCRRTTWQPHIFTTTERQAFKGLGLIYLFILKLLKNVHQCKEKQ